MKTALEIDPTDLLVGRRVREARVASGLSQSAVGKHLGLTFQQIQKYEKGTNRVAPSRLIKIAGITSRPVEWFYDSDSAPQPSTLIDAQIVTALASLPPHVRQPLRDMLIVLAEDYKP